MMEESTAGGVNSFCGCCPTPSKMQSVADSFIAASTIMLITMIFYYAGTYTFTTRDEFNNIHFDIIFAEIFLFFAGLMFLIAAVYLRDRVVNHKETYKKILAENYEFEDSGELRDCCTDCCCANSYQVVGWLVFAGVLPLIIYPVPVMPFIMLFTFLFIILFLVAVQPYYLKLNKGNGSVLCCSNGHDLACCCCCTSNDSRRPIQSDVVIVILLLAITSIFFLLASLINLGMNDNLNNFTAYLWITSAILLSVGLFCWHNAMLLKPDKLDENTRLLL